ncbi:MAG: hypothetical protein A3H50_03250 [Candidatus Levybacteria bacterium RIFCSPLOWO2_02_FULL_37_10]|nr:MAG: hypothetical protein A2860_02975 [Candidatus Levybacteria bacterium RIFCSPHIGHO2_01_FULL_37_33]OGH16241.1 MAG: hypothetical protein A3C97_02965 [Candidatus Levybacteria bacterium RIFCSPHIGHO2_02_FULL_37_11]OGH43611.1 MAG: hypothetical protein A3H50_03250 [Candidatus Levybacteria bacterium RIFCSPLOWO2_02_FULL_37_10]
MQFQRRVLSNGLRVLTIPMPSFKSVTSMILVGAGSRYETKKNNGVSHFLEHMAFKGTKKRPSALEISSLIDGIGGEFNAFTGKETTGYYIKSSSNHIELSLDVLSDMLLNSLFKTEEINKEKGVIIEEINLYEDTPSRKIADLYEGLLYGDTPMGWDIAGRKEVIQKITREDFISYLNSLYSAHNIVVIIAGGINEENVFGLVKKYFGKMKRFDTLQYKKVLKKQDKPAVFVKEKTTEQVHIAIGTRTVPLDHKDKYPLTVLAAILGGGMSSRLFHEVREKRGLAYYIKTNSENYQDVGTFVSTAGVDPKRVDEAVSVILNEYHKISNIIHSAPFGNAQGKSSGQISNKELKKAKEFLKGHLVLEIEDSRSVAGFYGLAEILEKKIITPNEYIEKINKVTKKEVIDVARRYLKKETLNLAVIGNFSDGQRFEKLLKL